MWHTSTSRIHHDGGSLNSFFRMSLSRKMKMKDVGGSNIYSWLSLVADIQWDKSDGQKLMCNDGTDYIVSIWKEGGVVDGAGYVGVGEIR